MWCHFFFFFFSSRRRHTRFDCDWSSDVCSSDLTFWGVQYHPEYSFAEIAATALRYGAALIEEGLFADRAELEVFINDLRALMCDPRDPRLTWKHGLGEGLQQDSCRLVELRNWLELQVLPYARQRH